MGVHNGKAAAPPSAGPPVACELCGACARRGAVTEHNNVASVEECSRCHAHCCSQCCVHRRFGSRYPTYEDDERVAEYAPVCQRCLTKTNLILKVPRCMWALIVEYCDATAKHRLLQLCHATQMGVVLPYPHTRYGWSTFFAGKAFISKGANGEVYRTTVRGDIAKELANTPIDGLDTRELQDLAGTTVAVKAIRKSTVFSLRKWDHIQREVDTLRKCRHRHVVQLYFVAQGPSEVYIVLQYVAGGDLFDWLVRQQIPMEYDVVVIARQLLETLHYMHEVCSVVHRDIKPENILLQPVVNARHHHHQHHQGDDPFSAHSESEVESHHGTSDELYIRLADFGYAKMLPRNETAAPMTSPARAGRPPLPPLRPGSHSIVSGGAENNPPVETQRNVRKPFLMSSTPCGTLGFAAPEILSAYNAQKSSAAQRLRSSRDSLEHLDAAAPPQTSVNLVKRMDIFAAGVTICILLTGCEPFPCVSSKEHMDAVQSGLDFSGPQWNYVTQPAKSLLRRMLAAKAADRPSALECLNSTWLRHEGSYADAVSENDDYDDVVHGKGLHHSASVWQLLSTSFQNSVHSLRKNDGWLFVQDAQGLVTTIPRQLVNENEEGALFSDTLQGSSSRDQAATIY